MTAPKLLEAGLVQSSAHSVKLTDLGPNRPQANGGTLNSGNSAGERLGRSPDWLKLFCDKALARKASKRSVVRILSNKDHPAFATMWKAAADRAHGKPKESKEISGTLAIRVIRDE